MYGPFSALSRTASSCMLAGIHTATHTRSITAMSCLLEVHAYAILLPAGAAFKQGPPLNTESDPHTLCQPCMPACHTPTGDVLLIGGSPTCLCTDIMLWADTVCACGAVVID